MAAAGLEEANRLNLAKTVLGQQGHQPARFDRARLSAQAVFRRQCRAPQPGSLSELREAVAALDAAWREQPAGSRTSPRVGDLRGTPPAAVIYLTDGINTEGESLADAARYARRKGVPLFTVGLGSEQPVRDVELTDLLVDEVVFVDDVVNFEYKLTGTGFAGKTVNVVLREKDNPQVLAQMKVTSTPTASRSGCVCLIGRPRSASSNMSSPSTRCPTRRSRRTTASSGWSASARNRFACCWCRRIPNFEFRYLKNMLERDSTIQLKTVLARRRSGVCRAGPDGAAHRFRCGARSCSPSTW